MTEKENRVFRETVAAAFVYGMLLTMVMLHFFGDGAK